MSYFKYYTENGDYAFPLSEFQDRILEGEKEITLLEMKRDIGGVMFCREIVGLVEKGDCGNICSFYNPCNGVSGRCRHLQNSFVRTGKKFKLTANKTKEV